MESFYLFIFLFAVSCVSSLSYQGWSTVSPENPECPKKFYDRVGNLSQPVNYDGSYCDYYITNDIEKNISLRLKFMERIPFGWREEQIMVIYDGYLSRPSVTINRDDLDNIYSKGGLFTYDSFYSSIRVRFLKLNQIGWTPFQGTYHTKGVCLPGQSECIGEDNCYNLENRCDGTWDCKGFGSDELNCTGCINSYWCYDVTAAGVYSCYFPSDRCNGRPTCLNAKDQENCDASLCNMERGAFLCKNKKCIKSDWVCDSVDDCHDFSDEQHCPISNTGEITMIAVMGSISCIILSVIITLFSCKLYMLRKRRLREREAHLRGDEALISTLEQDNSDWWNIFFRGGANRSSRSPMMVYHGPHISPITEVQNEIFARLSAPPPYQVAMATSRSFDEVMAEDMARRRSSEPPQEQNGSVTENSDEELLNLMTSPSRTDRHYDNYDSGSDAVLILEEDPPVFDDLLLTDIASGGSNEDSTQKVTKKSSNNTSVSQRAEVLTGNCQIYPDEPPSFEEAMGESLPTTDTQSGADCHFTNEAPSFSDDNSDRVPPSYSSLFPSVEDLSPNENSDSVQPSTTSDRGRFSFIKAPFISIKSFFSRRNSFRSVPSSSSLTELIDGQATADPIPGGNHGNNHQGASIANIPRECFSWSINRPDNLTALIDLNLQRANEGASIAELTSFRCVDAELVSSLLRQHPVSEWREHDRRGIYEGNYNVCTSSEDDDGDSNGKSN